MSWSYWFHGASKEFTAAHTVQMDRDMDTGYEFQRERAKSKLIGIAFLRFDGTPAIEQWCAMLNLHRVEKQAKQRQIAIFCFGLIVETQACCLLQYHNFPLCYRII